MSVSRAASTIYLQYLFFHVGRTAKLTLSEVLGVDKSMKADVRGDVQVARPERVHKCIACTEPKHEEVRLTKTTCVREADRSA